MISARAFQVGAVLCALLAPSAAAQQPSGAPDYSSAPERLTVVDDWVYFFADDGVVGRELWKTDGTGAGTVLVKDLKPGPEEAYVFRGSEPYHPVGPPRGHRGIFYFAVSTDDPRNRNVWRSDGTDAGTFPLTRFPADVQIRHFLPFGDKLAFGGPQDTLWLTDGTVKNTRPAVEFFPELEGLRVNWACRGNPDLALVLSDEQGTWFSWLDSQGVARLQHASKVSDTVVWNGTRYILLTTDLPENYQLWRTDGTLRGTVPIVKSDSSSPVRDLEGLHPLEHRMLLVGTDDKHGKELWATDGTPEGTVLVKDIREGPDESQIHQMIVSGGRVFFSANDGRHGPELWVSDGTPEGTRMLKDIYPLSGRGEPYNLVDLNGTLLFSARSEEYGEELWRSDGTPEGTWMIKDINPGPAHSEPYHGVNLNGVLIFSARSAKYGEELWRSDGTPEGTWMIKDINRPRFVSNPSSSPTHLAALGDRLFFVLNDPKHGAELWTSDGTPGGTRLVKDIFEGPASSSPAELVGCGDLLYFRADDGRSGSELWKSDGTPEGTLMVSDIYPGLQSSAPRELTVFNDRLYFTVDEEATGRELWVTDGTRGGTRVVADLRLGPQDSNPRDLAVAGDLLYFTADDGVHGEEIWVTDGTQQGTHIVVDLLPGTVGAAHAGEPPAEGKG